MQEKSKQQHEIDLFLSSYDESVRKNALLLRKHLKEILPDMIEQLDLPARMIAYVYGQRYKDMVCTLIPSLKGLKLGFYMGVNLPDPDQLLKGNGKISRYVEIRTPQDITSNALKNLLKEAFAACQNRSSG